MDVKREHAARTEAATTMRQRVVLKPHRTHTAHATSANTNRRLTRPHNATATIDIDYRLDCTLLHTDTIPTNSIAAAAAADGDNEVKRARVAASSEMAANASSSVCAHWCAL